MGRMCRKRNEKVGFTSSGSYLFFITAGWSDVCHRPFCCASVFFYTAGDSIFWTVATRRVTSTEWSRKKCTEFNAPPFCNRLQ